ncbi:MAG: transcriptional regulator YeiL [Lachnospiraceae bacterium]|nr:transcriptional regulator YeiL [Lachnospiraceae bacterium]
MIRINKQETKEDYYNHFPLSDYFDFDIRPYTSLVKFDNEEAILQEGEKPNYLYYMIDGRAKLFLSHENGRISLINFLNAPCFIGEMELLGAQEAANGVTAITPCTCYAVHINDCRDSILNDVKFLRHLCLFLSRKAIGNTYNYSRNQSWPLEVRLANFILLTACNGIYREKHTEAAEFLGVTYRHLLYVLADFVKRGILKRTAQGYYIQDLATLRNISEGR